MEIIRQINEVDKIKKLYSNHDEACESNVVSFTPPANPTVIGLLDDVDAVLSDPNTRAVAEDTLRSALQHIASQFIR